ncbi:MAG: response regulator [Spirochaetia bacterium]|nr:response regulator [Spirochaetia bacterium]MCF7949336.1 response regulator [Spirochaetia bacterium]
MNKELEIMIVEDEAITAMVMESELKEAGYCIVGRVVSGEDAVSFAKEVNIDVVLMDIRLAGEIDGIEAAAQIQNIRTTQIIFMTGYDDPETRGRANALNPLAFLNKPLDRATLIENLEKI